MTKEREHEINAAMLTPGWKKTLTDTVRDLKVVSPEFTGKLVINVNNGAICDVERQEKLK